MPSVDGTNYPGPWQMRVHYLSAAAGVNYPHVCSINMDVDTPPDPGEDFDQYDLISRAGLYYNAQTFLDALVPLMAACINPANTIQYAELWKYEDGTYNAAFQSTADISEVGTHATATLAYQQSIWSMRSQNGGVGYFEMLHCSHTIGPKVAYSAAPASAQDLFDFLTAVESPMLARDGGYLFTPLFFLPGSNERLFKVVNR